MSAGSGGRGRYTFRRRQKADCWFDPKKSSARTRGRSERSYVVEVESVRRKPVSPETGYSFRSTVKSLGPGACTLYCRPEVSTLAYFFGNALSAYLNLSPSIWPKSLALQ